MMIKQFFKQFLWSAAAISLLSMACTPQLKDYTQVTLQASTIDGSSALNADSLVKTQAVLTSRLSGLGITSIKSWLGCRCLWTRRVQN
jgi:hypothetical protein